MKVQNIKKDFIWNSLGSMIHAFNSLFFLIIVTRNNGLLNAGYFSYGFIISNIFLTIASFGGKGYQVTDVKKEFNNNTYISFRIITTIVATVLMILFLLLFNYSAYKYFVMILLIIVRSFESMSDVYHGILQKENKLYIVGKSLFYKNLLSLLVFLGLDLIFKNVIYSIVGWAIINILFLFLIDIKYASKNSKNKFKFDIKCKSIFKKCLFFFLYNFIIIFIINIPRYFIDFYLTDELQGIYGIITMPATMTVLLSQFILQPYALKLSNFYNNKSNEFKNTIKKINIYIISISLVCIILAFFFGIPVLNYIYNIDLNKYKLELIIVMLGAGIYSLNGFLSLIFTIKRKIKEQFYIYLISTIISLIISWILVENYEFIGGIISYFITVFIIFIQYMIIRKK